MENEKFNEATINRPGGDRPIDASQLTVSLEKEIKRLKREKSWKKGDRNSKTLFKSGNVTTVLVALRRGAEMQTQHPDDMLILQVLSGKLYFNSAVRKETIDAGEVVFFHEGIPYSINAKSKSIFLLIVVTKNEN